MRAARLAGPQRLELVEVALPAPGPDEVVLEVEACGVCGSNLHEWRHPELSIDPAGAGAPGAVGHEIAASVDGDLVVVEPNLATACGNCGACADGAAWFCRTRRRLPAWGFAERMVVPSRAIFRVSAGLGPAVASLVEPLACGVHAVRHSWSAARSGGRIDGLRVGVVGAGVTGLLAAAAARHLGAAAVAVVARHPHQAAAAAALGAEVLDAEQLRRFRPSLVIEAVGGSADTLPLAIGAAASRGEVAVLGLFDEAQRVDARRAVYRELRLWFPATYAELDGVHDYAVALDLLARPDLPWESLVTHRYPLSEVAEAFTTAAAKREGVLRVVVVP